ncbi:MAG: HAD-IA family hydrolase [Gammaproteobacteria bacterium]|nr:HAD-IA family hydrolase [Gammaproteobacteria bacterium]
MSILSIPRAIPKAIVFDWHATLADTLDAMYYALDDVFPKLEELGLVGRLLNAEDSKTVDDAKLLKYVKECRQLHPKIKADRKISRTDIFEILFGPDEEAKHIAHNAFDQAYRNHYGNVTPLEKHLRDVLLELKGLGLKLGVLTNRNREFMEHELAVIDGTGWTDLFDAVVCGDDIQRRKPAPDPIIKAFENLGMRPSLDCWYVGDSTTDIIAGKEAGVTALFYNGAQWEHHWIDKIFPGTVRHPHQPDAVVDSFRELTRLVRVFVCPDEY